jgi:rhodanese-related sulfurtransferase
LTKPCSRPPISGGLINNLAQHDSGPFGEGIDKSAPIILMCRSGGTRGAPSAKALQGLGFKSVYVVTDGFEGEKNKSNPDSPQRNVNGWKNSDLPWGYQLNPDKIYLRSTEKKNEDND